MSDELSKINTLDDAALYLPIYEKRMEPSSDIRRLFHYTNNNAKNDICCEEVYDFKFSCVNDFLDKNEGFNILEPYYYICGSLYESNIIDKDFFTTARSVNRNELIEQNKNTWILCMTKNGCSPYMKKRYAPKDGWIIGIELS